MDCIISIHGLICSELGDIYGKIEIDDLKDYRMGSLNASNIHILTMRRPAISSLNEKCPKYNIDIRRVFVMVDFLNMYHYIMHQKYTIKKLNGLLKHGISDPDLQWYYLREYKSTTELLLTIASHFLPEKADMSNAELEELCDLMYNDTMPPDFRDIFMKFS